MEGWRTIPEFHTYSISTEGRVRNDRTGRIMRPFRTGGGHLHVGMIKDGRQLNRSISKLVAAAFLPQPQNEYFDTPIHLDGEVANCYADNLMWRPRWFALKFAYQFRLRDELHNLASVRDKKTGEVYRNIWTLVSLRGLLFTEIVEATYEGTYVFPTMDLFEWVD